MKQRWLIPVFFLILAALACDLPYYDLLRVQQVAADPDMPGHAYALIKNEQTSAVYETDDYGDSWRQSNYVFPNEPRNSYPLQFREDTLSLDDEILWQYPRPTFRSFFFGSGFSSSSPYFDLPYGSVSNSAAGGALYVAMGTEGVLVGPVPGGHLQRDWALTANVIDLLNPLPLTLTDPLVILSVIALVLLIPPLPLIHAYILSRVWAYILPRRLAWHYAALTALGLSLLAALGVALWLTHIDIEYGSVVGVMTLITAVSGLFLTVYLAEERDMPPALCNKLGIAALVASLVVPLGVIAGFRLWWAIFLVLFGYRAYSDLFQRGIVGDKRKYKNKRQQGLIDKFTAETLLMALGIFILFLFLFAIVSGPVLNVISKFIQDYETISIVIAILGIVFIIGGVLYLTSSVRRHFLYEADFRTDIDLDDDFDIGRFRSDITAATIK